MAPFLKKHLRRIYYSATPEICLDVAAWAAKRSEPVRVLCPAVLDEIKLYVDSDSAARQEFEAHIQVLSRPQTLVTIEGATIRDEIGLVELPDGQICYEGNWWLPYLQNHFSYKRRFSLKNRTLSGNIYSLLCLWAPYFYHWFHDVLSRLETALPHLPLDTRFLINEKPRSWQLESLAAFGIGSERLEEQPPVMNSRVERLWFATPVGHTSMGSAATLRKVADRLFRYFAGDRAIGKPRRVYISRRKAASRRVVNEREIAPILYARGIETVLCEDLSLADQVRLFAEAVAIIGSHGAGLINMIYVRQKNAKIIELTAEQRTVPCYLVLARQLGFRFERVSGVSLVDRTCQDMRIEIPTFQSKIDVL